MLAKYENTIEGNDCRVWVGHYKNLHNMPHWHLELEIVLCQKGTAILTVNGSEYVLNEGTVGLCPSGYPHYINTKEESTILVAKFDGVLTKSITRKYQLKNISFPDKYGVEACLTRVNEELKNGHIFQNEIVNSLITELVAKIFRGEEIEEFEPEDSKALFRYKRLLANINENFEFITFQEAAKSMHMTEAYFSRYFKKVSGMTFSMYLNMVKIDKAITLIHLSPDITTSELMLKCGFNTLRHFNRIFKEVTGYSPKCLPDDFSLNIKTFADATNCFDPTLPTSILI